MAIGIQATIMKRTLAVLCEKVSGVVGRRYPFIVLSFCQPSTITAVATGDEISIMTQLATREEDRITADGTCCLSAAELLKLIDALPDAPLELVGLENFGLQIECGDFHGVVPGVDREESFPDLGMHAGKDVPRVQFDGHDLSDLFGAVSHCASRIGSKITDGIHMQLSNGIITCVTTDGHRLALAARMPEIPVDGEMTITVPAKAMGLLAKLTGTVILAANADSLLVYHGNSTYEVRLLAGEYPDYRKVIPTGHPDCLVVEAAGLRTVVERVNILSAAEGVVLDIQAGPDSSGDIRVVTDGQQGEVSDLVPSEVEGEPTKIRVHPGYLLESLKILSKKSNDVVIKFSGSLKPILLLPADHSGWNERIEVVMPMRMDD